MKPSAAWRAAAGPVAGALPRCRLALRSGGESRGYNGQEWLPLAYEQAADGLEHASPAADPPPLIEHAQQAGRFAALAIGSLDRDASSVPEAITDCLAHLRFRQRATATRPGTWAGVRFPRRL